MNSEVRATQSFVQVMASVWRRPSLTAIEVLWRWGFGSVALWLVGANAWRIWMESTAGTGSAAKLGLAHLSLMDLPGATDSVSAAMLVLLPPMERTASWLVPLLLTVWLVASAWGRAAVMRRMDGTLHTPRATLLALALLRVLFLLATLAVWCGWLAWAGAWTVTGPAARGAEPNPVLYFALAITGTLVLFVTWSAVSWLLSVAPMLSMLRGCGLVESLRGAMRVGPLRGKLFEVNLVMGIVKIALVVLAMVFSATPLPFESFTSQGFLWGWWAAVTVAYLVASDYFHVVRAAAYLELWKAFETGNPDGAGVR